MLTTAPHASHFSAPQYRLYTRLGTAGSLIILDKLVEYSQGSHPRLSVILLKITADLIHDLGPSGRKIVSQDLRQTDGQLNSETNSEGEKDMSAGAGTSRKKGTGMVK